MANSPPRTLLIETSGRAGRVGLAVAAELIAEGTLDATRRHARDRRHTISHGSDEAPPEFRRNAARRSSLSKQLRR